MVCSVLAWFPMLMIAVANGALGQVFFAKMMAELRAHQLSTLIGSVFEGLFIWLVIRPWPPSSGRQATLTGLIWLLLTVAFEFFMGLVLAHRPLRPSRPGPSRLQSLSGPCLGPLPHMACARTMDIFPSPRRCLTGALIQS